MGRIGESNRLAPTIVAWELQRSCRLVEFVIDSTLFLRCSDFRPSPSPQQPTLDQGSGRRAKNYQVDELAVNYCQPLFIITAWVSCVGEMLLSRSLG